MKRIMITFAAIAYTILFAVNLGFAAIDWDDLFLPTSVSYSYIGCAGGGTGAQAYRKGPLYFIDYSEKGAIAVSRDEYKYCTVFEKNQVKELKVAPPDTSTAPCSGYFSYVYIKFPFRECKEYDRSKTYYFEEKVRTLYLKKTEHPEWMNDTIIRIFEENNVTSGYYQCRVKKENKDDDRIHYPDEALYKYVPGDSRGLDDERFRKIHDMYAAEYANLQMCSFGTTKYPYLGRSTTVMEKLTEYERSMTPSRLLNLDDYDRYDIIKYPYLLTEDDNEYLNDAMVAYMKIRYFDHMLKGSNIVYYEIKSYKDMTIMTYVIPAEKKMGYFEFVSNDPLSREKTIRELKLAIVTGGKFPVIKGSNAIMHATFIMIVQNSIFGAVYFFADSRKRKLSGIEHK